MFKLLLTIWTLVGALMCVMGFTFDTTQHKVIGGVMLFLSFLVTIIFA